MVAENRGGVDADTICGVDSATNGVADSSEDGWSGVWDTNDDCGCICAATQSPYEDGGLIGVSEAPNDDCGCIRAAAAEAPNDNGGCTCAVSGAPNDDGGFIGAA